VSHTVNGIITVRDGRVTLLKNVTDFKAAVTSEDLLQVLQTLAGAGWKLDGDYELKISRRTEDDAKD
jgi:hypothetical protein